MISSTKFREKSWIWYLTSIKLHISSVIFARSITVYGNRLSHRYLNAPIHTILLKLKDYSCQKPRPS